MFLVSMACRVHVLEVDGERERSLDCNLNFAIRGRFVSLVLQVSCFEFVGIVLIICVPPILVPVLPFHLLLLLLLRLLRLSGMIVFKLFGGRGTVGIRGMIVFKVFGGRGTVGVRGMTVSAN